jgi:hypothetical protein
MSKQVLLVSSTDQVSFAHPHIRLETLKHFDLETFDPAQTYDPKQHIPVVSYMQEHIDPWYARLEAAGHRVVVDHLWDGDVDCPTRVIDNHLMLRNGNWMWYNAHYAIFFFITNEFTALASRLDY